MKLFAAAVVMLSVLTSEAAFAQAGGSSGPESLQTRSPQDAQRIKVTRSGEHSPTRPLPNTSPARQALIAFSSKVSPRTRLELVSLLNPGPAPPGTAIRWVKL